MNSEFSGTRAQARAGRFRPGQLVGYVKADKSLGIAYLLWFFLGVAGGHHFYLGRWKRGLGYLCTFGFFLIGWMRDLFTLPRQVKHLNAARRAEPPTMARGPHG